MVKCSRFDMCANLYKTVNVYNIFFTVHICGLYKKCLFDGARTGFLWQDRSFARGVEFINALSVAGKSATDERL